MANDESESDEGGSQGFGVAVMGVLLLLQTALLVLLSILMVLLSFGWMDLLDRQKVLTDKWKGLYYDSIERERDAW